MGRARDFGPNPIVVKFRRSIFPLLQGITVGNMAESPGRLPETAPQIRDPQGILLTPQQRIERARSLLGTALALALINNGWQLHSRPGEFHLDRGNENLDP